MASAKRKDKNGYVLRVGECCRSDDRYSYSYTDREKKRHVVYAKNIVELREKEKQIARDRDDGLDIGVAARMTLNELYDIHRITDAYNALETENAKKEGREPLILPKFSAHNLRHTFCTRLCENESNLKVIQSIMGHSDIQTTMDIYAECTEEKKQEVMTNLNGKIIIR